MNRLVFINLAIDQLWDSDGILKAIYPVKIPRAAELIHCSQDLGIFLANSSDQLFTFRKPDESFLEFLAGHGFEAPRTIALEKAPEDPDWISSATCRLQELRPDDLPSSCLFSGLSHLELALQRLIHGNGAITELSSEDFIRWNRKSYLVSLAKELNFPFPQTALIRLCEPPASNESLPEPPYILKPAIGSGGAGSLPVSSLDEPMVQHIRRVLHKNQQDPEWLLQKRSSRIRDYSCYADISRSGVISGFEMMRVTYGKDAYSWRHQGPSDGDLSYRKTLQNILERLGARLYREGYSGPMGIDGFLDDRETLYPAIDLNVRLDRTRLVVRAAETFSIPISECDSQRMRFIGLPQAHFSDWWERSRKLLALDMKGNAKDGSYFYPYLVSGLSKPIQDPQHNERMAMEISFFSGKRGEIPPPAVLTSWQMRVREAILKSCEGTEA